MPRPDRNVGAIVLDRVSFGYPSAGRRLFDDLSLRLPAGWTGIVGPNGAGKTTLVHLLTGEIAPLRGTIHGANGGIVCPQRTDDPPEAFDRFVAATDRAARRLHGRLGIDPGWAERWSSLSHGERKRAQIGAAPWRTPSVLALDEPTNHIDAETRVLLGAMLQTFRGVGLLVSHDRELLDALCRQCVLVDGTGATLRPGTYSEAATQAEADTEAARRAREKDRKEERRLRKAAADRAHAAAQADGRRSKRKIAARDHDAKARIDAARVSGKDGQAGRLVGQLEGRLRRADERVRSTHVPRRRSLGVTMRGTPARGDALWRTDGTTLALGATRTLTVPPLVFRPDDRVGVVGPNGAGKSTLVRQVLAETTLAPERIVHLPQEIDRVESASLGAALRALPSGRRGEVLAAIDCLGSDPARLLETEAPTPGEVRKLILALGLAREPHLVVMDEPTNHLDLPSIECLEQTLRECACALLLVSHDARFLSALVDGRWALDGGVLHLERVAMETPE